VGCSPLHKGFILGSLIVVLFYSFTSYQFISLFFRDYLTISDLHDDYVLVLATSTFEFGMFMSFRIFSTLCKKHDNNINNLNFVSDDDEIYQDYKKCMFFAILSFFFLPPAILSILILILDY
jgi:hypothetical protein